MNMTVERIKALPRTGEGIFDLEGLAGREGVYPVAEEIYRIYTEYETKENKKEGYPDIMAQMRVWNRKAGDCFTVTTGAGYLSMLLAVIGEMSPEIYENYRELVDMFRSGVKKAIGEFYDPAAGDFAGPKEAAAQLRRVIGKACRMEILLAEKYGMYCGEEA